MEFVNCSIWESMESKGTPHLGIVCDSNECSTCGHNPDVARQRMIQKYGMEEADRLINLSWKNSAYNPESTSFGKNYEKE